MKYLVSLVRTEAGYSVSCRGLPGCWSQGAAEEEALNNIQDAIREYLEVAKELAGPANLPRHDPVDARTMGGIVRDAGLTPQLRDLL